MAKKRLSRTIPKMAAVDGNIGFIFVRDLYDVKENITEAKNKMSVAGLNPDFLFEKKGKTAFKEALDQLCKDGLLLKTEENAAKITYQTNLVSYQDGNLGNEAIITKDSIVVFDKSNSKISSDNPDLMSKVNELFIQEMNTVRTTNIADALDKYMEISMSSIPLTRNRCAFFVPPQCEYNIRCIDTFVKSISGKNHISIVNIPDTNDNTQKYWKSVEEDLTKESEQLEKELATAIENVGVLKSTAAFDSLFERANELNIKMEAYSNLLRTRSTKLLLKCQDKITDESGNEIDNPDSIANKIKKALVKTLGI